MRFTRTGKLWRRRTRHGFCQSANLPPCLSPRPDCFAPHTHIALASLLALPKFTARPFRHPLHLARPLRPARLSPRPACLFAPAPYAPPHRFAPHCLVVPAPLRSPLHFATQPASSCDPLRPAHPVGIRPALPLLRYFALPCCVAPSQASPSRSLFVPFRSLLSNSYPSLPSFPSQQPGTFLPTSKATTVPSLILIRCGFYTAL